MFQESFKNVSRKFQECFMEVSRVFQLRVFQVVLRGVQGYLEKV